MNKLTVRWIGLVIILTIMVAACYRWRRGKVIDSWETSNGTFKVRVTSYADKDVVPALAGAQYVFQSSAVGTDDWRNVMTFRHDDPIPIPREQVRFVGDQIGFIFMGWIYAVTTDGGKNWSVWNAEHDLPNWKCCNYRLIADVAIAGNGSGLMRLSPIRDRRGEVPELHTSDYGRHWHVE